MLAVTVTGRGDIRIAMFVCGCKANSGKTILPERNVIAASADAVFIAHDIDAHRHTHINLVWPMWHILLYVLQLDEAGKLLMCRVKASVRKDANVRAVNAVKAGAGRWRGCMPANDTADNIIIKYRMHPDTFL